MTPLQAHSLFDFCMYVLSTATFVVMRNWWGFSRTDALLIIVIGFLINITGHLL